MKIECSICRGACCVGLIEVDEKDDVPDEFYKDGYMIVDENNQCIALENGKCLIYSKRPEICRKFTVMSECCMLFVLGFRTEHRCDNCCLLNK